MYINAHSTISFQDTFRNEGYSNSITASTIRLEPLHPNFEDVVPIMMRRRMSDAMKMSAACAKDCVRQSNGLTLDGIIIGTSMGSSTHTKNFIDTIYAAGDKAISPTAFITSTHNTIAGQLSLLLENRGYNITHTQNTLSFEHALFDAMVCLKEGMNNLLVGSTEEKENELFSLNARIGTTELNVTYGTSFFIVSNVPNEKKAIKVIDILCYSLMTEPNRILDEFLAKNNRDRKEIDLVLYTGQSEKSLWLSQLVENNTSLNYGHLSGDYMTNSGFALDLASDILSTETNVFDKTIKSILVVNNMIPENLGLILLEKTTHDITE